MSATDIDGAVDVPQVTLVGPYEGLLLAEAEIKEPLQLNTMKIYTKRKPTALTSYT